MYRGIMTLSLLVLLCGMLLVLMLFDDDLLRLHGNLLAQRAAYVRNDWRLQQQSMAQGRQLCEQLGLATAGEAQKIAFEQRLFPDGVRHFQWCERVSLFKQTPRQGILAGELAQYVHTERLAEFAAKPARRAAEPLYWFAESAEFAINGLMSGVIIAQGDLKLVGKGEFRGAVLSGGKLAYPPEIKLIYHSRRVAALVEYYSRWQLMEKSWHDFSP